MDPIEIRRTSGTGSGTSVLRIAGPLTLRNLTEFQVALRQPELTDTIIDLTRVPFIDSAGLGAIMGHFTHAQRMGYKFAVTGLSDRVQLLFKITKMHTVVPVFATVEAADLSFHVAKAASSVASA